MIGPARLVELVTRLAAGAVSEDEARTDGAALGRVLSDKVKRRDQEANHRCATGVVAIETTLAALAAEGGELIAVVADSALRTFRGSLTDVGVDLGTVLDTPFSAEFSHLRAAVAAEL